MSTFALCVCVVVKALLALCACVPPLFWMRGSASLLPGPASKNSGSCIHEAKMGEALV